MSCAAMCHVLILPYYRGVGGGDVDCQCSTIIVIPATHTGNQADSNSKENEQRKKRATYVANIE